MFIKIMISFLLTLLIIRLLQPVARRIDLLDKPSERKKHQGAIPMIGGIALYLSFVISSYFIFPYPIASYYWLFGSGILVLVGAIDDRRAIAIGPRALAAILAALCMILGADMMIISLGDVFNVGELTLPVNIAVPLTAFVVFGVINALNMIDGLDGLAAFMSLIGLAGLGLVLEDKGSMVSLLSFSAALCAFLIYNLQLSDRLGKIFLGDAGSMLLGYSLAWLLIMHSQNSGTGPRQIAPVTILFLIGLPLVDMVTTVFHRIHKGTNPFLSDRAHIHHVLLHAGFTSRHALTIVVVIGIVICGIGVALHKMRVPEVVQLVIFIVIFGIYQQSLSYFRNNIPRKKCGAS